MSLPFFKPRRNDTGGVMTQVRATDNKGIEPVKEEDDGGITACAEDLIRCVHAKDVPGVAAAMKAAFEILESQPHEEASHEESEE